MVSAPELAVTPELLHELQATLDLKGDVLDALEDAGVDLFNATLDDLAEMKGIGNALAFGIFTILQRFKAGQGIDTMTRKTVVPLEPPYLTTQEVSHPSKAGEYEPSNPAQFWRSDEGDMYRWDGKRSARFEWGELHRVVIVPHDSVQVGSDIVLIPKRNESWTSEARGLVAAGAQYFHRGFDCWIGRGNKVLAEVPRARRASVLQAISQRDEGLQAAL